MTFPGNTSCSAIVVSPLSKHLFDKNNSDAISFSFGLAFELVQQDILINKKTQKDRKKTLHSKWTVNNQQASKTRRGTISKDSHE